MSFRVHISWGAPLVMFVFSSSACSSGGDDEPASSSNSGGTMSQSGGADGSDGTGGASSGGGPAAAGGSTGGASVSSGGTTSSGGSASGGASSTGGAAGGGATSTGGANGSTGGMGSGGATSSGTVLFDVDFQARSEGTYTQDMVEGDFGFAATWNNGLDEGRGIIVEEAGNVFLRVTYPENGYGPGEAGVQFKVSFGQPYQELYFRYRVRFGADFDFVKGGKLPGLIGGSAPTGCSPAPDGFSARNMWRTGGLAVQYVYHPPQAANCGDDLDYQHGGVDVAFAAGTWHTVTHRIAMNDVGSENGIMQAWMDGVLVLDDQARTWITQDYPIGNGIDGLYFSTFFGGGDASWAPSSEQIADFDDLVVSTGPIID